MRKIHFVGSLPPNVTAEGPLRAMEWALHTSGWYRGHADLTGVPCDIDPHWIVDYLDNLEHQPALRAIRTGDSSDYDHMPIYRPTKGRSITSDVISMQRIGLLKDVINDYVKLRETEQRRPLRSTLGPLPPLRISLPSPIDLALFTFCGKVDLLRHPARTLRGAWLALRHLKSFGRAMIAEVVEINRYAVQRDASIVWQLETASVFYAMNLVPRLLQPGVAHVLAELTASALARAWDFDMELHLCDALAAGSPEQMVAFLNRLGPLLDAHGCTRPPVHLPFACGDMPPATNAEHYAPLAQLQPEWRIYAGVVDEFYPKNTRIALHHVEAATGRVVEAIGPACGLGRRTLHDAEDTIEACVAIADADQPSTPQAAEGAK